MNSHATPPELPREQAIAAVAASDTKTRIDGLLSLALYDHDWRFVQEMCLGLLDDGDADVVATAILGLSHLARLHAYLDLDRVVPELRRLRAMPHLEGRVDDALDDISMFVLRRPDSA